MMLERSVQEPFDPADWNTPIHDVSVSVWTNLGNPFLFFIWFLSIRFLQELLKHTLLVLFRNMLLKFIFLHFLATLSTFINLIWANPKMWICVALLDPLSTAKWAIDLLIPYNLQNSLIYLDARRILFPAARTNFLWKIEVTHLTNNGSTLCTIQRDIR